LKVATVNVRAIGGTKNDWLATAIAIAYKVGNLGADSIEVTVNRSDLDGVDAVPMYHHLASVYYSPNPSRSVWGTTPNLISLADRLASTQEIQADNEFWSLNEKMTNKGIDADAADKRAAAVIAKKYHIPKDWQLFNGGLRDTKLSMGDFNVSNDDAEEALKALDTCMRGKIIRMLRPCTAEVRE